MKGKEVYKDRNKNSFKLKNRKISLVKHSFKHSRGFVRPPSKLILVSTGHICPHFANLLTKSKIVFFLTLSVWGNRFILTQTGWVQASC